MTETVRHLEVPSAQLSYRRAGNGPGVLFIQGVGVIGDGWRPQIDGLGDRYTTISFDNRGTGASTLGTAPLTIGAMALDALAIMDAEKIERFHVAGHSMGGLIAQEVALLAPADKNGSLIQKPNQHLMCYQVRFRSGTPSWRGKLVFTNNQFGAIAGSRFQAALLVVGD